MEDVDQLSAQAVKIAESREAAGEGKLYPTAFQNLDKLKMILAEDIPADELQYDLGNEIYRFDGHPLMGLLSDFDYAIAMAGDGHSRNDKATVLALAKLIGEMES
ncbi:hypothetical protein U6G28_02695 [Actinomycetaceae bacterium MB13-C1-2]|nr:hypothetical protein U6G28_02695 [Actinomycetaceae bacterium MB13-C1-2]